jgi:hypothetical protein
MNALIIGHPAGLIGFVTRSLVLPTVVCGALLAMTAGAQLLGADLPDGTVHAQTAAR